MFFIPLPIVLLEILVFTTFVHFYSFWEVFLAYLLPSFLGAILFSLSSRNIVLALQGGLAKGQLPGDRVLHGAAVLFGAILMIIPSFSSRVLAVILLVPGFRHVAVFIFKTFIFHKLSKRKNTFVHFGNFGGGFQRQGPFPFEPEVHQERDVDAINVTPLEITHTKISEETPKKEDDSSEK